MFASVISSYWFTAY